MRRDGRKRCRNEVRQTTRRLQLIGFCSQWVARARFETGTESKNINCEERESARSTAMNFGTAHATVLWRGLIGAMQTGHYLQSGGGGHRRWRRCVSKWCACDERSKHSSSDKWHWRRPVVINRVGRKPPVIPKSEPLQRLQWDVMLYNVSFGNWIDGWTLDAAQQQPSRRYTSACQVKRCVRA